MNPFLPWRDILNLSSENLYAGPQPRISGAEPRPSSGYLQFAGNSADHRLSRVQNFRDWDLRKTTHVFSPDVATIDFSGLMSSTCARARVRQTGNRLGRPLHRYPILGIQELKGMAPDLERLARTPMFNGLPAICCCGALPVVHLKRGVGLRRFRHSAYGAATLS